MGVSLRFGGVAGREAVLTLGLLAAFGVTGRSSLFCMASTFAAGAWLEYAASSAAASARADSAFDPGVPKPLKSGKVDEVLCASRGSII